ncbi:MAG: hypothetical protein EP338_09400 [Bacteroidetes bacterium]|nr:MAG: hypothetical protein EP338_09400 [Bacteroidota bacterium]
MKITPKAKVEQAHIVLLILDFLLFFFLGFVLFLAGPFFLIIRLHLHGAKHSAPNKFELGLLGQIYDRNDGILNVWIIGALLFGILFSSFMVWRKLRKPHLIAIDLEGTNMLLQYQTLSGKHSKKEIGLQENSIRYIFKNATENSEAIIEFIDVKSQKKLLSTKKSKYWEYKHDVKSLQELRDYLNKLNILS